ncbi:hypothetical protein KI387_014402, partial [Taxus chinensis]
MPTITDMEEEMIENLHLQDDDDVEDDDEDEDESSDEEEDVHLGFLDDLKHPYAQSKAGGTPVWLDPINIPSGNDSCCGVCGNPLQLLMQVFANIDDASQRTLYVFMCPSMACLQQDQVEQRNSKPCRSVKVFRCQLPKKNPFFSELGVPLSSGVALCSWCGTWRGAKICSGCKLARYCSRQHQVSHWKSGHAANCRKIQSSSMTVAAVSGLTVNQNSSELVNGPGSQVDCQVKAASTGLWPEFEVIDKYMDDSDSGDSNGKVSTNAIEDEQEKDGEFFKNFINMEASKDQKHWASFQERVANNTSQVLRYCWSKNAKILWPRLGGQPQNTDIPNCTVCNGPRYFEFQVKLLSDAWFNMILCGNNLEQKSLCNR